MADRYTYIPLIGLFIAAAWGLAEWVGNSRVRRHALTPAAALTLAALAAVTRIQAGHWTNNETLFAHALAVTSENDMAHFHIGNIRLLQGRVDEAIAHLEEAIRIDPQVGESYNSLALAWLWKGRTSEGLDLLREAQRLSPGDPRATKNLTMSLLKVGMDLAGRRSYAEAVPLFEEAAALLNALPPECSMQWGVALLELNRFEEAAERFRILLTTDPQSGEAQFQLAYALSQLQRPAEALPHYRLAYGKPGVRSEAFVWIGDIYRKGDLCGEAIQVYAIIPPTDPAYPAAAAGIAACGGQP
jgi:tetratricopeptide (TPR) repeat protein